MAPAALTRRTSQRGKAAVTPQLRSTPTAKLPSTTGRSRLTDSTLQPANAESVRTWGTKEDCGKANTLQVGPQKLAVSLGERYVRTGPKAPAVPPATGPAKSSPGKELVLPLSVTSVPVDAWRQATVCVAGATKQPLGAAPLRMSGMQTRSSIRVRMGPRTVPSDCNTSSPKGTE